MKYLMQFMIILLISFVGEMLYYLIPLPIPASIYGIVILFLLLEFKIIKLDQVKETAAFLIEIMPIMFVPAAVGLMDSWGVLSKNLLGYIIVIVASTILVMAVSGRVTQFFIRRKEEAHE
ncbi:MAG: CidA/LrgA family protein [Lachnospiraceae bacterium]|nr:CidA/LrgA family protein [Lachnospiraceae bacterium]